jgi:hypothetical protein
MKAKRRQKDTRVASDDGLGINEVILEGGIADGKSMFINTRVNCLMIPVPGTEGYAAALYRPSGRFGRGGKQIWVIQIGDSH